MALRFVVSIAKGFAKKFTSAFLNTEKYSVLVIRRETYSKKVYIVRQHRSPAKILYKCYPETRSHLSIGIQ